jgi:hypothetical protein
MLKSFRLFGRTQTSGVNNFQELHSKDFNSNSLTSSIMIVLHNQVKELAHATESLQPSLDKPNPQWACAHCHSDIHKGGQGNCVLTEFKWNKACTLVCKIQHKVKDDPTLLANIIKNVINWKS